MPSSSQHSISETFIRFVVGTDRDDADCLDGLFVNARLLREEQKLEPYEVQWLDEIYAWFNDELPCPPFTREKFPADAVCWYHPSAAPFIARMWDIAALLREHACPVRILKTQRPGSIIYRDAFQIVAVPRPCRWIRRKPKLRQ